MVSVDNGKVVKLVTVPVAVYFVLVVVLVLDVVTVIASMNGACITNRKVSNRHSLGMIMMA